MNRRHVILALGVTLYVLQLGLLTYAHSLAAPALQLLDMVVSAAIALALGLADWYATHYLLQALDRIEQVYAQDVSQQLEQTLEYMKAGSKNAIMYTIDQLAKVSSPAFKNMILPLIKAMVGDMFDGLFPKSSEDKVMNKLNQISGVYQVTRVSG